MRARGRHRLSSGSINNPVAVILSFFRTAGKPVRLNHTRGEIIRSRSSLRHNVPTVFSRCDVRYVDNVVSNDCSRAEKKLTSSHASRSGRPAFVDDPSLKKTSLHRYFASRRNMRRVSMSERYESICYARTRYCHKL